MDFAHSSRAADLAERVRTFVDTEVLPAEEVITADILARRARGADPWTVHPLIEELKTKARSGGLWNLFLPAGHEGAYAAKYGTDGAAGLTNLDYAPVAEATGRSYLAPLVFNCNAPDTGNMEVLLKYGSQGQKDQWLDPLLDGRIRSVFLMTEPGVASSDATNMEATARLDGDEVVINGRKWWSTGAGHPDAKVGIFMGLTDESAPRHQQHSMVAVPLDAPGVLPDAATSFDAQVTDTNTVDAFVARDAFAEPVATFTLANGRGPTVTFTRTLWRTPEVTVGLFLEYAAVQGLSVRPPRAAWWMRSARGSTAR